MQASDGHDETAATNWEARTLEQLQVARGTSLLFLVLSLSPAMVARDWPHHWHEEDGKIAKNDFQHRQLLSYGYMHHRCRGQASPFRGGTGHGQILITRIKKNVTFNYVTHHLQYKP
jgi:hypothetical protein